MSTSRVLPGRATTDSFPDLTRITSSSSSSSRRCRPHATSTWGLDIFVLIDGILVLTIEDSPSAGPAASIAIAATNGSDVAIDFLRITVSNNPSTSFTIHGQNRHFDMHCTSLETTHDTRYEDERFMTIDGWAADFIPFYDKAHFICSICTTTAIARTVVKEPRGGSCGRMISSGSTNSAKWYRAASKTNRISMYSPGVSSRKARRLLFYTGRNPHYTDQPVKKYCWHEATILVHWHKVEDFSLQAPAQGFEPDDWRDPFVYIHR
ncbi:MAG: hypothetical protein MZU97_10590 [Bacillus subtilis]|nr:hypothetical protein [Bacillus subtilis]